MIAASFALAPAFAGDELAPRLQAKLDLLRDAAGIPGANFALVSKSGSHVALASGFADRAKQIALKPTDRMLAGSVGKTFFAALAWQLIREKKLDLDARIETYLHDFDWFARLPNAKSITVRELMNHTSGIVRYELDEHFIADLRRSPDKVWSVADRVAYLLDRTPPFEAGKGWDYSDTNYIVLGAILEKLVDHSLYDEVAQRFLAPLELEGTLPSISRTIPRLCQGHAGAHDPFGLDDLVIVDGRFAINPQFEWTGGGFATTADDLARWALALYGGKLFDAKALELAFDGVDAPMLGRGAKYGLGVILRDTSHGRFVGHSGFFPGYMTEMGYFVDAQVAVAVQVNTSDYRSLKKSPLAVLFEVADVALEPAKAK